jgi:hypothetical protein
LQGTRIMPDAENCVRCREFRSKSADGLPERRPFESAVAALWHTRAVPVCGAGHQGPLSNAGHHLARRPQISRESGCVESVQIVPYPPLARLAAHATTCAAVANTPARRCHRRSEGTIDPDMRDHVTRPLGDHNPTYRITFARTTTATTGCQPVPRREHHTSAYHRTPRGSLRHTVADALVIKYHNVLPVWQAMTRTLVCTNPGDARHALTRLYYVLNVYNTAISVAGQIRYPMP